MSFFKRISLSKIDPTDVKDDTASYLSEAGQRLGSGILKQAKEKHEDEMQKKRIEAQKALEAMRQAGQNSRQDKRLANDFAMQESLLKHQDQTQAARFSHDDETLAKKHQYDIEMNGTHAQNLQEEVDKENRLLARAQQKQARAQQKQDEAERKQHEIKAEAARVMQAKNAILQAMNNGTMSPTEGTKALSDISTGINHDNTKVAFLADLSNTISKIGDQRNAEKVANIAKETALANVAKTKIEKELDNMDNFGRLAAEAYAKENKGDTKGAAEVYSKATKAYQINSATLNQYKTQYGYTPKNNNDRGPSLEQVDNIFNY